MRAEFSTTTKTKKLIKWCGKLVFFFFLFFLEFEFGFGLRECHIVLFGWSCEKWPGKWSNVCPTSSVNINLHLSNVSVDLEMDFCFPPSFGLCLLCWYFNWWDSFFKNDLNLATRFDLNRSQINYEMARNEMVSFYFLLWNYGIDQHLQRDNVAIEAGLIKNIRPPFVVCYLIFGLVLFLVKNSILFYSIHIKDYYYLLLLFFFLLTY